MQYLQTLKSERGGKPTTEVLEEGDVSPNHKFMANLKDDSAEAEPEEVIACNSIVRERERERRE